VKLRNSDFKALRVKGTSPNVDVTCVTQSPHVDFVEWYHAQLIHRKRLFELSVAGMVAMMPFSVDFSRSILIEIEKYCFDSRNGGRVRASDVLQLHLQ
jgi:hypothetical protein